MMRALSARSLCFELHYTGNRMAVPSPFPDGNQGATICIYNIKVANTHVLRGSATAEEGVFDKNLGNGDGDVTFREILRAQAHIWFHAFSFIKTMACLKCTIELSFIDLIHHHDRPMTHQSTLHPLPHAHPRPLRLLRVRDLDEADRQTGYALTCVSWLLVKHDPPSLVPFALFTLKPLSPGRFLSAWLRNEEEVHLSSFEMEHGIPAWDAWRNPLANGLSDKAMASELSLIAKAVVDTGGL